MSSIDDLIEILRSGDEWDAVEAAKELGQRKVQEAVPVLIEALHSEKSLKAWENLDTKTKIAFGGVGEGIVAINALQCASANALAMIGDERALTELLKALQTTDESEVRLSVAHALDHFNA